MTNLAGIGHNGAPELPEVIAQNMERQHADELALYEKTVAKEADLPKVITNDEEAGIYADYVKELNGRDKLLDSIRKTEKSVYDEPGKIVHNFFKKKLDVIEEISKRVKDPLSKYLQKKEDEKRRIAKEKADEEKRIADEALKKAQEDAEIARKAKEEAEAEEARIKAENEKKLADAAAAAQKIKDDAEAAAKKLIDDAKAKALETTDGAAGEAKTILKDAKAEADAMIKDANKEAKEIVVEVKQEVKQAEAEIKDIKKEAVNLGREADRSLDTYVRQDRVADKAERSTLATTASMTRTRGDASMVSISEKWVGTVSNRATLDLETLRNHIPFDALEQAVQSWVNANKANRQLAGAHIFQDTKTNVR